MELEGLFSSQISLLQDCRVNTSPYFLQILVSMHNMLTLVAEDVIYFF